MCGRRILYGSAMMYYTSRNGGDILLLIVGDGASNVCQS